MVKKKKKLIAKFNCNHLVYRQIMLDFNQLLINKLILTSLTLKTNHLIIQNDCPTFCPSFAIKINELNIKQN